MRRSFGDGKGEYSRGGRFGGRRDSVQGGHGRVENWPDTRICTTMGKLDT